MSIVEKGGSGGDGVGGQSFDDDFTVSKGVLDI